jgi:hypothetical protein
MHRLITRSGILTVALCLAAGSAVAGNVTIGQAGRVSVELISSEAAFRNTLSLVSPAAGKPITGCDLEPADGLGGLRLLSEKISQRGCRVTLDSDTTTAGIQGFASGTVLKFNFCAQTDADDQCEFIWSSDPAENDDAFDHVLVTPIAAATHPGAIFRLSWEDKENGGDMDFNDLIAVVRVEQDSDGDGLWDDWEEDGIDTTGDGTIDLDLPALGADPQHKDLFLEIDYMDCAVAGSDCAAGDTHTHEPLQAALNAVIQAFADAPVNNPDGVDGIDLHIDVDDSMAHQNVMNIPGLCFNGGAGIGDFDAIKADPAFFGPTNPRRYAYRYTIFSHRQAAGSTVSGCGELPGNDFQVSLGGWNYTCQGGARAGLACGGVAANCPGGNCVAAGDLDGDGVDDEDVGTVQQQAGTLMHEFGHNLDLQHGGDESANNRKPNYLSIMNYSFQMTGIGPDDPDAAGPLEARVDYSPEDLPDLVENNLDEIDGVGDGTDDTRYFCPDFSRTDGPAMGNIDWNCNNGDTDVGVSSSINGDCSVDNNGNGFCDAGDTLILRTLTGFDDWENIDYDFQATEAYEDGDHDSSLPVVEMDHQTYLYELCDAAPVSQGFWHRQCLGAGMITPGRDSKGRGPQSPTEPEFVKELVPAADMMLQSKVYVLRTCEDGIHADPPSDPCEKALKQYTSLVLNVVSGRLGETCGTDLAEYGCSAVTVAGLLDELAALYNSGDGDSCKLAKSCADAVNNGKGVVSQPMLPPTPAALPSMEPTAPGGHGTASDGAADSSGDGPAMSDTASDGFGSVHTATPEQEAFAATNSPTQAGTASTRTVASAPETERHDDGVQELESQLRILAGAASSEDERAAAQDALLTALGGGYEPEVRLALVRGLSSHVDVSLYSLLERHLEDIEEEARAFGDEELRLRARELRERLEQ